jgi:hypothetical protein
LNDDPFVTPFEKWCVAILLLIALVCGYLWGVYTNV